MSGASYKTFFTSVAAALAAIAGGNWAIDTVQTVEFQQSVTEFSATAKTSFERFIHGGTAPIPTPSARVADGRVPEIAQAPKQVKTAENAVAPGNTATDMQPHAAKEPASAPAPVAAASGDRAKPGSIGEVADQLLEQLRGALAQPEAPAAPKSASAEPAASADSATAPATAVGKTVPAVQDEPAAKAAGLPAVVLSFAEMQYEDKGARNGTVILGGRAEPGANLRFTVDGDRLGKASADDQGNWRLTAEKMLDVGPHWLTAEQVDAKGETIARAESPFDRAQPSTPAAPVAEAAQATPTETVVAKAEAPSAAVPAPLAAPVEAPAAGTVKEVQPAAAAAEKGARDAAPVVAEGAAQPAAAPAVPAEPAPAMRAENAPAPTVEATQPAPTAMAGSEGQQPAAGQPAAAGGKTGEGVDIKQTATKLWDSFKGIFTVDPADLRKSPDGSGATGKGEERLTAGGGAAGETGAKAVEEPAAGAPASGAGDGKLQFTSVGHNRNRSGDALRLAGSAEPGSRIRLYDGEDKLGETVADKTGAWSFVKKGTLPAGPHMFRAARVAKGGRIEAEARMQYDQVASVEPAPQPASSAEPAVAAKTADRAVKAASAASTGKSGKAGQSGAKKSSERDAKRSTAKSDGAAKTRVAKAGRSERSAKAFAVGKSAKADDAKGSRKSRKAKDEVATASRVRVHTGKPEKAAVARHVQVSKGATLMGIAHQYCGSSRKFRVIHNANKGKVKNPDVIHTGDKLAVVCS